MLLNLMTKLESFFKIQIPGFQHNIKLPVDLEPSNLYLEESPQVILMISQVWAKITADRYHTDTHIHSLFSLFPTSFWKERAYSNEKFLLLFCFS